MGVIFQDFVCYNFSVGENIGVGLVEVMGDQVWICDVVCCGMVDEVIVGLFGGYDQLIGCCFKLGMDLFGGQWQKIVIVCVYMCDVQVMIFDELIVVFDVCSEFEVFQCFKELFDNCIVVLILYCFLLVCMVDCILVLVGGCIEVSGIYVQLMVEGGCYVELFELQVVGYC